MAGHVLRGSRVGSGRAGEADRGAVAPRHQLDFHCANGHVTRLYFAVEAELPDLWDCPNCGLPAGLDSQSPPPAPNHEPYKTHLAYVKERRTDADGAALLDEALAKIAGQRTPRD